MLFSNYHINDMNGIIIVNQNIGHNEYKIKRFKEEFSKRNIRLDVFINNGTLAEIKNSKIIINLPEADFVFYLDKDIYLARLLEKAGYRLFNKADFIKMCDDKMLTFITCANKGINMPSTIAGPLIYTDLKEENYVFLDNVIKELGLPMVVKKVYGSLGEGVYLVNTKGELRDLYTSIARNPVIFQRYVKTSFGQSVRVLIIDGKVFGSFIRKNNYDFRSNYGDEASSKVLEKPEKFESFAQEISDKLQIEYAGIDLLLDENDEPILCEINSNAFFEEFEKVTGLDVAKAIADMVVRKVEEHE